MDILEPFSCVAQSQDIVATVVEGRVYQETRARILGPIPCSFFRLPIGSVGGGWKMVMQRQT